MPRLPPKVRRRSSQDFEVLGRELEESLVWGQGIIGVALELRTVEDWARAWARWRHVIEPKVAEHRPGTRAAAAYVTGEIPLRPVLLELPPDRSFLRYYVPGVNGEGIWFHDLPPPYAQDETDYLRDLGIVDAKEFARSRKWRRRRTKDCPMQCQAETYVLETALFF